VTIINPKTTRGTKKMHTTKTPFSLKVVISRWYTFQCRQYLFKYEVVFWRS